MRPVAIVGAGPSGLGAAYELSRHRIPVIVIEKNEQVGGLARTINHNGLRFDVGPHRFFTKSRKVLLIWQELLQEELLSIKRQTRILYNNTLFDYPLILTNALNGLGWGEASKIVLDYLLSKQRQWLLNPPIVSFEDWVVSQFGQRLYEVFFKTYSEKVWGIPCQEIGPEWAGQRIKGLSLFTAVLNALVKNKDSRPKTLIDHFFYPRLGAGQFYEYLAAAVEANGGQIWLQQECVKLQHEKGRLHALVTRDLQGRLTEVEVESVITSAPITQTVQIINPAPPPEVLQHARQLRFRSHVGVDLEVGRKLFPDQWIYIHAPDLQMARISDYTNFSPAMSDSPRHRPVTVEYFAFTEDKIWQTPDEGLIILAKQEMERCPQFSPVEVGEGFVVRHPEAYPLIRRGYETHLEVIKAYLASLAGLQLIGRAGLFRYDNQDHALVTGLLAGRNLMGGNYDISKVNAEAEYHESGSYENLSDVGPYK